MSAHRLAVLHRRGFGAFGDAWTDWCAGNWSRHYASYDQCAKGANGAGYSVGFTDPWTLAGVVARGGAWEKKAMEVAPQVIDQVLPKTTPVEPAADTSQEDGLAWKNRGMNWTPKTVAGAFTPASPVANSALKIGGILLAVGIGLMLLKKRGKKSALAGYRRRTSLKRTR